MIPGEELERLVVTAINATSLGRCGQVGAGYAWLQQGLLQARDLEQRGLAWAKPLAARWERVLSDYCRQFQVPAATE
ncbi:MAG: hypothetical protein K0Q72_2771 [Armatimonadetes bacterium]|nr:hypothetical protein [Armatimonadota bacterium]